MSNNLNNPQINQSAWQTKWLPHPFLAVILGISWLLLMHSISFANLLIALILALVIPKVVQFFIPPAQPVNWIAALKLFFVVLWDIVISNLIVARLVLGSLDNLHPKWIRVPLECDHPHVNTLLALIITTTPGTVSAGLDDERGSILVHSLNALDEQAVINEIKIRYEQPLMKIYKVDPTSQHLQQRGAS